MYDCLKYCSDSLMQDKITRQMIQTAHLFKGQGTNLEIKFDTKSYLDCIEVWEDIGHQEQLCFVPL